MATCEKCGREEATAREQEDVCHRRRGQGYGDNAALEAELDCAEYALDARDAEIATLRAAVKNLTDEKRDILRNYEDAFRREEKANAELRAALAAIHARAHELSTGPTVPDGYWEIRGMAGEVI